MSQVTSHILDTSKGKPAEGVKVILFFLEEGHWLTINGGATNKDGRIPNLTEADNPLKLGIYKLKFETLEYFEKQRVDTFYPYIEIIFQIKDKAHYHVPLLLNPFGYSTYRGS